VKEKYEWRLIITDVQVDPSGNLGSVVASKYARLKAGLRGRPPDPVFDELLLALCEGRQGPVNWIRAKLGALYPTGYPARFKLLESGCLPRSTFAKRKAVKIWAAALAECRGMNVTDEALQWRIDQLLRDGNRI
jgi:hypothetical protein